MKHVPWYRKYPELKSRVEELMAQFVSRCEEVGADPDIALSEHWRTTAIRAVQESNWQEGIYVEPGVPSRARPFWNLIELYPLFFKNDPSKQAELFLHEVHHLAVRGSYDYAHSWFKIRGLDLKTAILDPYHFEDYMNRPVRNIEEAEIWFILFPRKK